MVEAYHDAKLKRTKVCACASVLIALIIVGGVLGSIALWKVRFYQDNHRQPYRPNLHQYPPHNAGTNKYPGHNVGTKPSVTPKLAVGSIENDIPDILRASTVLPSSGPRGDTISIDDGTEKSRFNTERSTTTVETHTVASERTVDEEDDKSLTGTVNGGEEASESFGSFDHSFDYGGPMTSFLGSSSSSLSSLSDYLVYPSFDEDDNGDEDDKLIPRKPDYESDSASSVDDEVRGSGFGSGGDQDHGSGFGDMEFSGDSEDGSGDVSSIDPDMYLPLPEVFSGTQQFPSLENDYSSSVTEISNVLKDPKQEYEFWKYIYDQSDVLVDYIEGAKQKLIRQEDSLNVVDPDLPMVQLVRTPQPEKDFKGKCYNVSKVNYIFSMKLTFLIA